MQAADWINSLTDLGPTVVAVVAIVMWSIRGLFARGECETRRQTELLERIVVQLDKQHS